MLEYFITEQGKILIKWSISFGKCPSVAYAEIRAVYKGILKGDQLQISTAIFHTDS